jgi:rhodanese-related sulfurtransferase
MAARLTNANDEHQRRIQFMRSPAAGSPSRSFLLAGLVALAVVVFALTRPAPPAHDITNVSVAQAKALIDGGALVVDVRPPDRYAHRHIPGALLVPLEVLRRSIPASLKQARAKNIVVYCGDGLTHGPEGTAILNKAGFAGAVNIAAGIEGWAGAGLPVAR